MKAYEQHIFSSKDGETVEINPNQVAYIIDYRAWTRIHFVGGSFVDITAPFEKVSKAFAHVFAKIVNMPDPG